MDGCVFERGAQCSALSKKDCAGCAFYKTAEDHEASAKSAMDRILGLGKERRDYLLVTYHPTRGKKRMDPRVLEEGVAT